jgi:hypothetical protein
MKLPRMTEEERGAIMFEAMRLLLDDNLVWSQDFEDIRPALGSLFLKAIASPELSQPLTTLAVRIIKSHG